jgi:hypothetical protein
MRVKMRTCVCNPATLKTAEELHARSKGYSTLVVMSRSTKFRTYVSRHGDHSSWH